MALLRRTPRVSTTPISVPPVAESARDEEIRAAQDRFIGFWGEMGTRWGVQRSMAEVHALLFIVAEPLSAEDIMERLSISRGSVSTTLKQLVEWGLVQRVNPKLSVAGRAAPRSDRREFHQAEQDVWKLFYTILRARKRREFDPLIEELGGCKVGQRGGRKSDRERAHDQRIEELLELCLFFDGLANTISKSGKGIERATKILARLLGAPK
jgi:DNA-binding transcriptional regulator GbsR (MarR family)